MENGAKVKAIDETGRVFWWTGRSGSLWVSADERDAFAGRNIDGARAFAAQHNRNTALHGLRFVAVVAEPTEAGGPGAPL